MKIHAPQFANSSDIWSLSLLSFLTLFLDLSYSVLLNHTLEEGDKLLELPHIRLLDPFLVLEATFPTLFLLRGQFTSICAGLSHLKKRRSLLCNLELNVLPVSTLSLGDLCLEFFLSRP